jgi:hypothetical protein
VHDGGSAFAGNYQTMRKSIIITFLIPFSTITYCQQRPSKQSENTEEKVLKIIYEGGSGSRYGSTRELTITPDSIFYFSISWSHQSTINGQPEMIRNVVNKHQKNDNQSWQKLISTINLTEFDKAKNSEDNRAADGVGANISIITSQKEHTHSLGMFINDEKDKPIKDFLDEFLKQFKRFE